MSIDIKTEEQMAAEGRTEAERLQSTLPHLSPKELEQAQSETVSRLG
jgi:hypothetical protein